MKQLLVAAALCGFTVNCWADHHGGDHAAMPDAETMASMQAMQMAATPGEPHAKLAESVGQYTAEMQFFMDPSSEPMTASMTVERRMGLQGRVLVEHWQGEVMGAQFQGMGRTGYDNVTKRYWSTWTDNMSTGLLVMYGNWDADKNAMVLEGDSVHPVTGETYTSRAVSVYPKPGVEAMEMFEDHGAGEFKSMAFKLTRVE